MSGTLDSEIDTLKQDVSRLTSVEAAAKELIAGFAARLAAAISAATNAGATAEHLTALNQLHAAINSGADDLAQAVQANTPAADPSTGPAEPTPQPAQPTQPAQPGSLPGVTVQDSSASSPSGAGSPVVDNSQGANFQGNIIPGEPAPPPAAANQVPLIGTAQVSASGNPPPGTAPAGQPVDAPNMSTPVPAHVPAGMDPATANGLAAGANPPPLPNAPATQPSDATPVPGGPPQPSAATGS